MLKKYVFILLLQAISSASLAQNTLTCASSAGALTKCKLTQELTLAKKSKFTWAPDSCSQEYVISFTFPCVGNLHGLAFSAGLAAKDLHVTSGEASSIDFVSGPNDLRIVDSNPKLTRSATMFGACTLHVSSVNSFPSDSCVNQVIDTITQDTDALFNVLAQLKTIDTSSSNSDNGFKSHLNPLIERLEEYSEISPNALFANLLQQEIGTLKEIEKECELSAIDRTSPFIKSLILECEKQIEKNKSALETMKIGLIEYIRVLEEIKSEKLEDLLKALKRIQTYLK